MRLNKFSQPASFDRQPPLSETMTCLGWWPAKLHVNVMLSPSTMVVGLTLRAAVHAYCADTDELVASMSVNIRRPKAIALRKHRPRNEFALAMHMRDARPPSDQSRPKYEAAHWRYTHAVAHKKPDAAAGCAGRD